MGVFLIIIIFLIFFITMYNSKYIKFKSIYKNILKNTKNIIEEQLISLKSKKKKKYKIKNISKDNNINIDEDNITISDVLNTRETSDNKQEDKLDEQSILSNLTLSDINSNNSDESKDSLLSME